MANLLQDLITEEFRSKDPHPCPLCDLIRNSDIHTGARLRDAASGTLSERALVRVLTKNKTGIGRRTVARHRAEEHTP